MPDMRPCPRCETENDVQTAKKCGKCKLPFPVRLEGFCPICGEEIFTENYLKDIGEDEVYWCAECADYRDFLL